MVKKKVSKLLSSFLAIAIIASIFPMSVSSLTVFDYTVQLTDGTNVLQLDDVKVTLTSTSDESTSSTALTNKGIATFTNFVEEGALYTLTVSEAIGYEDVSTVITVSSGETSRDVTLTAIETVSVSGKVTDENGNPYKGATVSVSGYNTLTTETNDEGVYSFIAYKGKTINIAISASDDKYETINSQAVYNSDTTDADYQFVVKTFDIKTSVTSDGGTISAGENGVTYGESRSIEIQANDGYRIEKVTVNTVEVSEAADQKTYTLELSEIKDNYDITVSFYRMTYKIIFTVSDNGEVTYLSNDNDDTIDGGIVAIEKSFEESTDPSQPTTVTIKATPNTNYRVSKVSINGEESSFDINDYVYSKTLEMTKDYTFVVEFSINQYKLDVSYSENGSAYWNKETAEYDTDATLTIVPDDGYAVSEATVNGNAATVLEDENGIYITLSNITENKSVSITFAKVGESDTSELDKLTNDYYTISFSEEQVKEAYYEGDTYVVVLPKDATAIIQAVSPYSEIKYNSSNANGGYTTSLTISETTTISNIYVKSGPLADDKVNVAVNVKIIIDKVAPVLNDIDEPDWTNNSSVTITGTVSDAEDFSGLYYIVWSKDSELSETEVLAATENTASINNDGTYSFTVEGEQNSTYYVYAVDYAGNVSDPKTVQVKIDTKSPTITGFTFSTNENSVIQDLINFTTFGTFCSQTMYVTVSADDEEVSSGIKQITLYYGNSVLETKEATNGSATFELAEEKFSDFTKIYAVVTDVAGNESTITYPTDSGVTSKAESDEVKISNNTDLPTATITIDNELVYSDGSNRWYDGDVQFIVDVKDEDNGIWSVVITMNGKELEFDLNDVDLTQIFSIEEKVTNKTFVVSTSQAPKEGINEIKVVVTNSAGWSSTVYSEVYIDTEKPEITAYDFTPANNDSLSKVINFLSFGIFFNEQVKITVTADDEDGSGVNKITLYLGDEEITSNEIVDNKAVFTVPDSELDKNSVFSADISATATDNVGNTSKAMSPSTVNSNIEDSKLMLENIAPTIEVEYDKSGYYKWYSSDVTFKVSVTDEDSGIRSIYITINDKVFVDVSFNEGGKFTYVPIEELSTATATIKSDGSYTIEIEVTDNAGNVSIYTETVYKDSTAPYIYGLTFSSVDYVEGNGQDVNVEITDYGFYFKEDTDVTIYATDDSPSSGIASITYYLIDYTNDAEGVIIEEDTIGVDSNNSITITIPANFKGQIYARATDNAGNTGEYVNPDMAIVESEEKHNEEEHITFEKAATTYTTNDGTELYAEDVDVTITVTDTYSGIREIEWSVVADYDTDNNQSGKVTLNNDKTVVAGTETDWDQKDADNNIVTVMQKTITVTNNSNNITLWVKMTDRAGNTTEETIVFSIDKTAPTIEITYSDEEVSDDEYTDFYSTTRTATITITERNFRAYDVEFEFTNTDSLIPTIDLKSADSWQTIENSDDPDKTIHVAIVEFTADGDYTFDISYKDNAENAANEIEQHTFTIDMTKPEVTVVYDNYAALNGNYYNTNRTATITITEHNFDASRVNVVGVATDDGVAITYPAISAWQDNGDDTYTATISYTDDAKYVFDIEVYDKANNSIDDYVAEEFYIDKTAPSIEITGVADQSANNGTVAPIIRYYDTNFDVNNVSITLTGVNNGAVNYSGSYSNITNGQVFTYADFERVQEVDDIYTLTVTVTDLAGNATTQSISFSANRFGSVYDLSAISDILNKYLLQEIDITFREINVDSLARDSILIKLTKNGTPTDLVEGVDYTVQESGGNGQWSVYTYTINKELFTDDGSYIISVYSIDVAGNINENIDASKAAEISFGIDKTSPVIIPIDLESGKQYPVEGKTGEIEIKDNLVLESVTIYLNGEEVEYAVDGEIYTFTIPESNSLQDVIVVAMDAAGNITELTIEDFLVSTNLFVRWYNNTPLFIGSIIGLLAIVFGLIFFFFFYKDDDDEEEEEKRNRKVINS